jgi:hypothetical protein
MHLLDNNAFVTIDIIIYDLSSRYVICLFFQYNKISLSLRL